MMRSLLKVVDNRRDQSTKHYIPQKKLAIIDKLTQAPQMPLMLRDYPRTRTPVHKSVRRSRPASYIHQRMGGAGITGGSSRRSHSSVGGGGIRLTPLGGGTQTHPPARQPPAKPQVLSSTKPRPADFHEKLQGVNPQYLAKLHKNLQEKVAQKFKGACDAFRRFDADQSGAIDFGEFKLALRNFELIDSGLADHKQVEALFHLCDESGAGQISYQDFCKWIKAPDKHENLMVRRESPYFGRRGGMSFGQRSNWIRAGFGVMCE